MQNTDILLQLAEAQLGELRASARHAELVARVRSPRRSIRQRIAVSLGHRLHDFGMALLGYGRTGTSPLGGAEARPRTFSELQGTAARTAGERAT